jgi:hypothetical protein
MYQDAVMVPVGDWAKDRLSKLSETDKLRDESRVRSGFGKNVSNWLGRDMVYPTNVIHMATECTNRDHSATFPVELPVWFIKLFTRPGDIVLSLRVLGQPHFGSSTGQKLCRVILAKYVEIARKRTLTADPVAQPR